MTALSATIETACKAHGETLGLGVPWFRAEAPLLKSDGVTPQTPPFVVVTVLPRIPIRTGDNTAKRTVEQVQIDVYQCILAEDLTTRVESFSLAKDIERGFISAKLPTAPEYVWRCMPLSVVPFRDSRAWEGRGEIRDTITLNITRDIQSRPS